MTQPMDSPNPASRIDVIDLMAGLAPGNALHTLRHQRDKVAAATQGSYDAIFDTAVEGLSLTERLLVALYACSLSRAVELSDHYRSRLVALEVDPALLEVAESSIAKATATATATADPRLRAMLAFTHTLITNPIAGDKPALMALSAAGLTTPAIVALAQLIAFLSYQLRVVAGLKAMQALELEEAST
jgi:CMD domain protein